MVAVVVVVVVVAVAVAVAAAAGSCKLLWFCFMMIVMCTEYIWRLVVIYEWWNRCINRKMKNILRNSWVHPIILSLQLIVVCCPSEHWSDGTSQSIAWWVFHTSCFHSFVFFVFNLLNYITTVIFTLLWCFVYNFQLGRCRSVTEFEKLNRIGEGTYGIVCK